MPLSPTVEREELHHRNISMKVYRRKDGLFDVEAHLRDTKPFDFHRVGRKVLIDLDDLDAYAEQGRVEPPSRLRAVR